MNPILYQSGAYTIRESQFGHTKGYAVYQDVGTNAVRVGQFSYRDNMGKAFTLAKRDTDRRAALRTAR